MESDELLIVTYANRRYERYVLPFVHFALRNNPHAHVEIFLEDRDAFQAANAAGIAWLHAFHPGRFALGQSLVAKADPRTAPGTVRFLEQPRQSSTYVYIGDIDVLVFEDLLAVHLALMREHGLPFSNIIRGGSIERGYPKLSGLHFAPYALQYPAVAPDLDLRVESDEHVLFHLMRNKGVMVPRDFTQRPICGIHMSPNRDPGGRTSGPTAATYATRGVLRWPGAMYYSKFLEQIREEAFRSLLPELDIGVRMALLAVEGLATGQLRRLHRLASGYLLDKRLVTRAPQLDRAKVLTEAEAAVRAGNPEQAASLASMACLLWPEFAKAWELNARAQFMLGNVEVAVEVLLHLSELTGGAALISEAGLAEANIEQIRGVAVHGEELLSRL